MKNSVRNISIAKVMGIEGGYVDQPLDSGGKTNFGVTETTARRWGFTGSMKNFSAENAFLLYTDMFWDEVGADHLENESLPKAAGEIFEIAVNCGTARAVRFLQCALNAFNLNEQIYADLTEDGVFGSASKRAISALKRKRGPIKTDHLLTSAMNAQQGAFYLDLVKRREKDEAFVTGWFLHRVSV